MLGEELAEAAVTNRGFVGDRAFAILDSESGRVASGKSPRKWGSLLDCTAKFADETVQITLPDGTISNSGQPDCHAQLSEWLGRSVTLTDSYPADTASLNFEVVTPDIDGLINQNTVLDSPISRGAAPGTFFNFAPLHLLTTASLRKLQALLPNSAIVAQRFRPNIVVDLPGEAFIENEWQGRVLNIGSEVQLRVIVACPRCVVTTLPQSGGELLKDEKVLRGIVQHNRVDLGPYGVQACLGVYAQVIKGGLLRPGDSLEFGED
jgi:uncharacterized protein YcbX